MPHDSAHAVSISTCECSGCSLNVAQTGQVSSWLHQAVGSLPIKQTVCLSPWVPTQQTLRAGRKAARGGSTVMLPFLLPQKTTIFETQKQLWGILNDFPQIIHQCSEFISDWAHTCASVHTTIQDYSNSPDMLLCFDEMCERKGQSVTYDKGQHHKNTSACVPLVLQLEVSGRERQCLWRRQKSSTHFCCFWNRQK